MRQLKKDIMIAVNIDVISIIFSLNSLIHAKSFLQRAYSIIVSRIYGVIILKSPFRVGFRTPNELFLKHYKNFCRTWL